MKKILEGKADLIVANLSDLLLGDGFHNIHTVEDILSFIWTRKAKEADEFQLVVPATRENIGIYTEDRLIVNNDYKYKAYDLDQETYVTKNGDTIDLLNERVLYPFTDMVGVIEKVEVISPNNPDDAETMTISGRSLECLFDRRIVWEPREFVIYDGSSMTAAGNKDNIYRNFISSVYEFLQLDMICPKVTGKKKSKSGLDFQNRAIWNIVMGDYGQAREGDSELERRSRTSNAYMKKVFTDGQAEIINLNGESLYEVLKKLCTSYGLSMRTYLLANVDVNIRTSGGVNLLDIGKYDHVLLAATNAEDNIRMPANSIPGRASWIFLELDAPCNRSYLENTEYDYVVFSQNLDNLANISYAKDTAQIRNITKIMGEDAGKDTRFAVVYNGENEPSGLTRREIFTDASNIKMEDINEKNQKKKKSMYIHLIEAEGRNTLTEHSRNRNFMFNGDALDAQHNVFKYGEDYSIGDLVQFVDENFATSSRVQISEIVESINENGYEFTMTYDTPAIDFVKEDPLGYYYYTYDDDDNVITITGIRLGKVMEDGLQNLDPCNAYYSLNKKKPMNFNEISDVKVKDGEKVKVTITPDTDAPFPVTVNRDSTTTPILDAYDIGLELIYSI